MYNLRTALSDIENWVDLGIRDGYLYFNLSGKLSWDEGDVLAIGRLPDTSLFHASIKFSKKKQVKLLNKERAHLLGELNKINSEMRCVGKLYVSNGLVKYEYISPNRMDSSGSSVVFAELLKTTYLYILDLC